MQARGVFAMMWALLHQLAPRLPADAATLADLQQRLAGQPSSDATLQDELRGVAPIVLTATVLAGMPGASAATGSASASSSARDGSGGSSSNQRRQASTPEAHHLAVRRRWACSNAPTRGAPAWQAPARRRPRGASAAAAGWCAIAVRPAARLTGSSTGWPAGCCSSRQAALEAPLAACPA